MYCLVIGRVWIVVCIVWGYCGEYIVGGWGGERDCWVICENESSDTEYDIAVIV